MGRSRTRTWGARGGWSTVITNIRTGNDSIQASRTASDSSVTRVLNLEGSWKHQNNVPLYLIYCKNSGPYPGIVSRSSTILDAFFFFFIFEVWSLLVQETNSYAAIVGAPSTWYDTYIEEMKAFIGMLLTMRISKLSTLEMYWSVYNPDFDSVIIRK